MMKKTTSCLSLALLFGTAAMNAAPATQSTASVAKPAATTKTEKKGVNGICYVNTLETMQKTKKGTEISKRLEDKRKSLGDAIQQKEKQLTQMMNEFKSKESTLSAAARDKQEGNIVKMRREYEALVQGSEDELKLAMQRATEELSKEIENTVIQMAEREGYKVVIDAYTGRTIYAAQDVMVTADLVKAMDSKVTKA